MRRLLLGGLSAGGGACVLLVCLATIDERVRTQLVQMARGNRPSGELAAAGSQLKELAWIAGQAVKDQSIEHAPLTVFALAAFVLVVFMLRS